jgi:hypothetical protein
LFERAPAKTVLLAAALAALPAALAPPLRAGAEGPLDRVRALVEEKRRLEWENETMTKELAFASTTAPYVFVDLRKRTFEFRVRGKVHKTYKADAIEIHGDADRPLSEGALHALAPNPIDVVERAGGPPELKPPPVTAPDANGSDFTGPDPNSGPVHSDAGILGVDAPINYDVTLQAGISLEIRTAKAASRWDQIRGSFAEAGRAVVETWRGWTGGSRPVLKAIQSAAVRVIVDEETAKAFYHSILPGEHVYFLPAAPPPVRLVASLSPPPSAKR